jgi:predicted proteasome-type protease
MRQVYWPATSVKPRETPYFQVGESNHSKPVLDRVITHHPLT